MRNLKYREQRLISCLSLSFHNDREKGRTTNKQKVSNFSGVVGRDDFGGIHTLIKPSSAFLSMLLQRKKEREIKQWKGTH